MKRDAREVPTLEGMAESFIETAETIAFLQGKVGECPPEELYAAIQEFVPEFRAALSAHADSGRSLAAVTAELERLKAREAERREAVETYRVAGVHLKDEIEYRAIEGGLTEVMESTQWRFFCESLRAMR